jgi:hypothetical protein
MEAAEHGSSAIHTSGEGAQERAPSPRCVDNDRLKATVRTVLLHVLPRQWRLLLVLAADAGLTADEQAAAVGMTLAQFARTIRRLHEIVGDEICRLCPDPCEDIPASVIPSPSERGICGKRPRLHPGGDGC